MFGRTLFGGSRFLFWSLAPLLLLFALVMALLVSDWTSRRGLFAAVLIVAALLLVLQLYDRTRFHWAGRLLAGIVFLAYLGYLTHELMTEGMASLSPRSRGASAFKAMVGLLVIGTPAALYACLGRWTFHKLEVNAIEIADLQRAVCEEHGATYTPCDPSAKIGISSGALRRDLPLNGLRHQAHGGTTGWYIWGGEELGTSPDFFRPMHVHHLGDQIPEILPYLGLPPGWRFLVTPETEDVWLDESLLQS